MTASATGTELPALRLMRQTGVVPSMVRDSYDVGMRLCDDPVIVVVDDVLTKAECEHIVSLAGGNLRQARVSSEDAGVLSDGRTGSNTWIKHWQTPMVRDVVKRLSDIVGIPSTNAESLQVIHYGESEEYRAHYDAYDLSTEKGRRCTVKGGQRLVTALLYLNDVDAGGGTGFPNLELEVQAVQGRMVVFHNTVPGTTDVHPDSLHGGLPVHFGEKWACNLWFREEVCQLPPAKRAPSPRPGGKKGQGARAQRRKAQRKARRGNR